MCIPTVGSLGRLFRTGRWRTYGCGPGPLGRRSHDRSLSDAVGSESVTESESDGHRRAPANGNAYSNRNGGA